MIYDIIIFEKEKTGYLLSWMDAALARRENDHRWTWTFMRRISNK
jgi:hypothetical protein